MTFYTITSEHTGAPELRYVVREHGDRRVADFTTEHGARGYVHETGGWIGTPDPITYRGEVVR